MKTLVIDKNSCLGCGTCAALCPLVFKVGDEGKAEVIDQNADTAENIQTAIDSCPVSAIKWEEK